MAIPNLAESQPIDGGLTAETILPDSEGNAAGKTVVEGHTEAVVGGESPALEPGIIDFEMFTVMLIMVVMLIMMVFLLVFLLFLMVIVTLLFVAVLIPVPMVVSVRADTAKAEGEQTA